MGGARPRWTTRKASPSPRISAWRADRRRADLPVKRSSKKGRRSTDRAMLPVRRFITGLTDTAGAMDLTTDTAGAIAAGGGAGETREKFFARVAGAFSPS